MSRSSKGNWAHLWVRDWTYWNRFWRMWIAKTQLLSQIGSRSDLTALGSLGRLLLLCSLGCSTAGTWIWMICISQYLFEFILWQTYWNKLSIILWNTNFYYVLLIGERFLKNLEQADNNWNWWEAFLSVDFLGYAQAP